MGRCGVPLLVLVAVTGCDRLFELIPVDDPMFVDASTGDGGLVTCPASYILKPHGCYRLGASSLTAAAAEQACEADREDAHLAVISSAGELADVVEAIGAVPEPWLGLIYTGAAVPQWINGEPYVFTMHVPEGEGNCIRMMQPSDWDDEPCSATQPPLCEIDGKPPILTVPP